MFSHITLYQGSRIIPPLKGHCYIPTYSENTEWAGRSQSGEGSQVRDFCPCHQAGNHKDSRSGSRVLRMWDHGQSQEIKRKQHLRDEKNLRDALQMLHDSYSSRDRPSQGHQPPALPHLCGHPDPTFSLSVHLNCYQSYKSSHTFYRITHSLVIFFYLFPILRAFFPSQETEFLNFRDRGLAIKLQS